MPNLVQRSFTAGELAPSLRARVDINKYSTGLALCQNFIIRAQGGVYSRPGTLYCGALGVSSARGRLIPFSFNTEQAYVLVFENLKIRIIKNGGYILSGGVPYEVVTPYTTAQLSRLYVTQSADTLTICHPSHAPANLGRVTDTNWTLTAISYAPSVTAPTISTTTAVGTGAGTYNKTYTYVVTKVDVNGVESLASAIGSITTPSLSVTAGVLLTMSAAPGTGEYYRVYKDPSNGSGVYGWIGDTKVATFEDYNVAPIVGDSPPVDRQPFTGAGNYPSTVTYYQQRQVLANTTLQPQSVFTTQTGNYKSMRVSIPSRADDAVTLTIAAQQVNEIRHLLPIGSLLLMTSGGEWKLTEGQNQVLEPSTAGVKPQSFNGASWVPPVIINSTALYVQNKGSRIRDLGYEFASDKFTGNDLSLLSEHLFADTTIEEMAYAAEPYGILWCVRSDGVLLGLTYQREQQVSAWHQHSLGGVVESVASISEGTRDAVYLIVKRTINGATVRYIERMEPRTTTASADVFCVDCGLRYSGAAATVMSGLGHLEGQSVACVADGNEVTGLVVTSGAVTLPRAATKVSIGLAFTPVLETLDIDQPGATTVKGKAVSVSRLVMELEKSRGGFVGPKHADGTNGQMLEIKPRVQSDGYDSIVLKDYKSEIDIEPGWNEGGGVRIEQRAPMPLAILSIIPSVDIGG